MSQSLNIRYTPTQKDYAQVLRLFFLQRTGTRISLAFLIIAFGIILYTLVRQVAQINLFEIIWLVFPPLFVFFIMYIQPNSMAKQVMKNEQLAAETTWEISDEGLQISTSFGSSHLDWEGLAKLVTSKEYYLVLLRSNKNTFRFVPRRAFSTSQDQDLFVQLINYHITN